MRTRTALSLGSFVVVALLAVSPGVSTGQSNPPPHATELARFVGTFRNHRADGGASVISAAVMAATEEMGAMRRRIARRRILETETPIEVLTITPDHEGLVVDLGRGRRNAMPRLGTFFSAPTADGGTVKVKLDVVHGRLRVTYRDPDGGAVQYLGLSGDGNELTFESTISSPHLPSPITYELELDRLH